MLEVSGITKKYGGDCAVRDISFSAGKGEVVGLIGHNGSGKSTTMNIITGYLPPSAGTVRLDGFDIREQPAQFKRRIGFLPETAPLYQDLTVEEQLRYACRLKRISEQRIGAAVDDACQKANITGARGRLIKNLSKGYRQRVGFAQAVLDNPELLILDEPTSGLDPKQIMDVRETVRELGKEQIVILSSHILSEITAVCGRLLILSNGRLVADSTPERLIEQMSPRDEYILKADGDQEKIRRTISAMDAVDACGSREGGGWILRAAAGADIVPALFETMTRLGCPIRMFVPVRASLDDIFLRLTNDARYESEDAR